MPDTLFTSFDALAFTWPPSYGTIFQIGAVVYFLGWLLIQWDNARPMRGSAEHETASAHGTARWARWRDVTKAKLHAKYDGIILGLWKHKGKVLRVNTDSHIITLAPTRSGKGVSAIIPNMLHYKGSCFIIDPKGENARISARRRRAMGQAVYVLDPWRLTGFRESSYNPLDALDPESPDLAEDAALIADTLVVVPEGSGDGAFWQEEARALLTGLILYVACCEPPESRHLLRVRELLTQSGEETTAFYEALSDETAANGLIARMANRMLQKSERERSSVTSTAQSHTHFLDSPRMASVLSQSSLALSSLKTRPTTIYLVLPAERLQTHARWLRLMVSMSLTTLARTRHKPEKPVLFVLDEFAALGRLEAVESAMGLMAGYGVQLWPILQDISQLQGLYGDKWRNFFANAGVVQTFNVTEPHTAEIISNMLGVRTAVVRSASGGRGDGNHSSTNRSESFQATQRPSYAFWALSQRSHPSASRSATGFPAGLTAPFFIRK